MLLQGRTSPFPQTARFTPSAELIAALSNGSGVPVLETYVDVGSMEINVHWLAGWLLTMRRNGLVIRSVGFSTVLENAVRLATKGCQY